MATYYVDSNATGLDDGSSWTDAWTSITSSTSVSAGDIVLVASNHSELFSSSQTINWANGTDARPIKIISTNSSTGNYEQGAITGEATGSTPIVHYAGRIHVIGMEIQYWLLRIGGAYKQRYENCIFKQTQYYGDHGIQLQSGGTQQSNVTELIDCTFDSSSMATWSSIKITYWTNLYINNASHLPATSSNPVFVNSGGSDETGLVVIENSDLSNFASLVTCGRRRFRIAKCKVNSPLSLSSATPTFGGFVSVEESASGTLASQATGITAYSDYFGDIETDTTRYRTGGANDGVSDFAWELTSNTNTEEFFTPLISSTICKWVESGSQTITVYIAGGASLNNDDFWIEVESPSELASPTAQGKFRTTKPDPLATPTALTSDTSSWTGTGVGTAQKVEVAISPTIAGTVTVRCYLAKPSTTVYVDPKISTDGYQRVFNGVLVDGDAVSSGGGGSQFHPLG